MSPAVRRARLAAWLERRGDALTTREIWALSCLYMPSASRPDGRPDLALTDLLALLASGEVRIWKPARHWAPLRWVHVANEERLVTPVGYARRVAA
jgi:hypothetical protein